MVLELAGQHAAVQQVEIHQLDQVGEARAAVVQAVQQAVLVVHLQRGETMNASGAQGVKGQGSGGTHGYDLEVLDSLRVAQRQHKRLRVGLAVPQQEDAAWRRTRC